MLLCISPEVAVETLKAGELEDRKEGLGLELIAPIPGRGEAPVNARAAVVAAAIECLHRSDRRNEA